MPVLLWQNSLPKLLWGQTGSLASVKIQTVLACLPLSLASFFLAHRRTYFRFRICNWQGSRGVGKKPLTLKPIFRGVLKPKFCEFFVNICDSEKSPLRRAIPASQRAENQGSGSIFIMRRSFRSTFIRCLLTLAWEIPRRWAYCPSVSSSK